ncbi:PREDICTED: solute carrier family 25 member 39-like [Charadrius vociferus]|uniref:solute carrier family 25 member 39-like n=1 Tax=Charadrius vociferus TaxID=50402 RepID=UPI00052134FD|nr:PREDICTED: solute carrier family 25 member 39-like [Charadrius vociferus]
MVNVHSAPQHALSARSVPWGAQQATWKCFLYCNGLMDHLYVCQNGNGCTAWYKAPTRFTGTLDAFVKITRYEGIRSLWSGLPPTLVLAVPATVIYFTTYDQLRDYLHARTGSRGHHIPLLAGGVAAVLTLPFDVVNTQRQIELGDSEVRPVTASKPSSTWLLMRRIRAESGTRGLFAGFLPRVIKVAPACAIMISTYELGKTFFQKLNQERRLPLL